MMISKSLPNEEPKRIAVFRLGHLGDTIIGLPALWTIRRRFPKAHIIYLTQVHQAGRRVQGLEVLRKGTVFDEELYYTLGSEKVSKIQTLLTLFKLRAKRIDMLVYIPPHRTPEQLRRDETFFRLAGVKRIIGMTGWREMDYRPKGNPLPVSRHESDILLDHLSKDGVLPDVDPHSLMDMGLSADERAFASRWLSERRIDTSRPIVGIGPGSKMPAKLWPVERFIEVSHELDRRYHPTFVLFGSKEEHGICQQIADEFDGAVNAAGELSVRQSAAVFERCQLYVGNDTGTMHIAAAANVRCVGIFSARDYRGRWYPYGDGHAVHRVIVPCEGCMLEVCDRDNLCLKSIGIAEVTDSAIKILDEVLGHSVASTNAS